MSSLSGPRRVLVAALTVGVLFGASACSGSGKQKAAATSPASSGSTSSPPASRTSAAPAYVNPLDGGTATTNGVVAVKIDDTGNGRPQRNIDLASVVYIEQVEGGLTRLLAVFNRHLPIVEAVRSTRAADPEILAQYGPIAYVASGGAKNPLSILDASPLKTSIGDRGGPGISRDGSRTAPYNETADLAVVAKAKKAPKARNVGFSWSTSSAFYKNSANATVINTSVGNTAVEFKYDAASHRYVRYIDGTAQRESSGALISTPNVIVQFCKVVPYYKDRDVNGNPNAFTYTVGKGTISVFRDGKRVNGTWSRPSATSPTSLRTTSGKSIPLAPGGLWVVLTKTGTTLTS